MLSRRPVRLSAPKVLPAPKALPLLGLIAAVITAFFFASPGTANAQSSAVRIETTTNGADADAAPGPSLTPGDALNWTYTITVNGKGDVFDLIVTDSQGAQPSCEVTGDGVPDGTQIHPGPLSDGQRFTCRAGGVVQPAANGTYRTEGSVTGFDFSGNVIVTASDRTHYTPKAPFVANPSVSIRALVNGDEANSAPGPFIDQGEAINWSYVVTNTGNTPLNSVRVTNSGGVAVNCGGQTNLLPEPLAPGETTRCKASSSAAMSAGLQSAQGVVRATVLDPTTGTVTDKLMEHDPHNYTSVGLPAVLAFTGPADYLLPSALALLIAGAGFTLTGQRVRRRTTS